MKVLKFGGTSVGSAQNIKNVASLVMERGRNIVVLSAMAGVTNTLVEIADYLTKGNVPGAQETTNNLELRYRQTIDELFSHDASAATEALKRVSKNFDLRRYSFNRSFSSADEREILAQGELMSTALMDLYLRSLGVKSVVLPALEYMRTLEGGEPDMNYIDMRINRMIESEPSAEIFITEGYICRNDKGEVDNLRRGGSDYTASIIGAVIEAREVQISTACTTMTRVLSKEQNLCRCFISRRLPSLLISARRFFIPRVCSRPSCTTYPCACSTPCSPTLPALLFAIFPLRIQSRRWRQRIISRP